MAVSFPLGGPRQWRRMFAVTFREQWVVQAWLPAVKEGDKRIILVDGEFAGAVNRVPAPDDLRSNML